jgi:hypothetical protein
MTSNALSREQKAFVIEPSSVSISSPSNDMPSLRNIADQVASASYRFVSGNCTMCTIYCDDQLEYEMKDDLITTNDFSDILQLRRQQRMLFDETSVVESVTSRE